MYKPMFNDSKLKSNKHLEYISLYDFEGDINKVISFLEEKRLKYPDKILEIEINKSYEEVDVIINEIITETDENYAIRKEKYENALVAWEKREKERVKKAKQTEKELYEELKKKYG
jgi:methionine salvage enolase-phosphatase E1